MKRKVENNRAAEDWRPELGAWDTRCPESTSLSPEGESGVVGGTFCVESNYFTEVLYLRFITIVFIIHHLSSPFSLLSSLRSIYLLSAVRKEKKKLYNGTRLISDILPPC